MMKVYVIEGGWNYEGIEVIGVYYNKEDAELALENIKGYDYVDINEYEVK